MSAKAGHFKIGLFVLVAVALAAGAVVVLGAGAFFRERIMAETYVDESVVGLEPGAAVKYRGVRIGAVEKIDFVFNRYPETLAQEEFKHGRQVLITLALDPRVMQGRTEDGIRHMIEDGLRIRLASSGLTGAMYLEVDHLDPKRNPPMKISWTPKSLYIASAPSTQVRLMDSLERVLIQVEGMKLDSLAGEIRGALQDLSKLFKDEVTPLLRTVSAATKDLPNVGERLVRAADDVDSLLKKISGAVDRDLAPALANFNEASRDLKPAVAGVNEAVREVKPVLSQVGRAARRVDALAAGQQDTLDELLENLRGVSGDLRELTGTLKRHPSSALFGDPPPRKE